MDVIYDEGLDGIFLKSPFQELVEEAIEDVSPASDAEICVKLCQGQTTDVVTPIFVNPDGTQVNRTPLRDDERYQLTSLAYEAYGPGRGKTCIKVKENLARLQDFLSLAQKL